MQATDSVDIKGLVRFSYLTRGGFNLSKQGLDAARAVLYDPARLDRRFRFFETWALPSLTNQTDQNFQTGILITDDFPDAARARLETLVTGIDNVHMVVRPPMEHIQACKAGFEALPEREDVSHVATFRLDDDDAMHRETIARIRDIANRLLALREGDKPMCIAFNRGFYLDVNNEETPVTEVYERAPLGVGMAVVAPKGAHVTVFRRNHRHIAQYYDTYTEVQRPMFLRSVHDDNDSIPTLSLIHI